MTWETPSAIDLRFGFEITMYIANRQSLFKRPRQISRPFFF